MGKEKNEGIGIAMRVIRKTSFDRQVTPVQKPEGDAGVSHSALHARVFRLEGTARAEAQRQGHTWLIL